MQSYINSCRFYSNKIELPPPFSLPGSLWFHQSSKQYKYGTYSSFVCAPLKRCVLCCIYKILTDYHKAHERVHWESFECNQLNVNNRTKCTTAKYVSVQRIAYTEYKFISSIFGTLPVFMCNGSNRICPLLQIIWFACWTLFISNAQQSYT